MLAGGPGCASRLEMGPAPRPWRSLPVQAGGCGAGVGSCALPLPGLRPSGHLVIQYLLGARNAGKQNKRLGRWSRVRTACCSVQMAAVSSTELAFLYSCYPALLRTSRSNYILAVNSLNLPCLVLTTCLLLYLAALRTY